MDSLAKRINHIRTKAGLNRSEFARALGVSAAHISAIERGASASDQFLKAVAVRYKVSEDWLINGTKGGVVEQQQDDYAPPHGGWNPSLTTEEFVGIPRGLGMGRAMDLLGVIYASRDEMLIRAINSNLDAFALAVQRKQRESDLIDRLTIIESRLAKLNDFIKSKGIAIDFTDQEGTDATVERKTS
jgi:transcriptional regulator with XRE-family HTH domain